MPKVMKRITIISFVLMLITAGLFHWFGSDIYLTLAITCGTITYHLGMRLLVGLLYNFGMRNRADYTKKWYQIHSWENKLYQFLHVKAWKDKMPTYNPEWYSIKKHTWNEIAQVMCQAELVHETNMVLSFLPLIAAKWFGAFSVFFITSAGGALLDCVFVIMQRYNRARIVKLALREKKIKKAEPELFTAV